MLRCLGDQTGITASHCSLAMLPSLGWCRKRGRLIVVATVPNYEPTLPGSKQCNFLFSQQTLSRSKRIFGVENQVTFYSRFPMDCTIVSRRDAISFRVLT
ncbi:hypothetical protein VTI28DRAFT_3426 [Corynascus sepedonium]